MKISTIDRSLLKNDLRERGALDPQGRLALKPLSFYQQFSQPEITAFAVREGLYSLPTEELVDYLKRILQGRTALEIGAGNGVLAQALDIRATDNHMQTWREIAEHYALLQQPVVSYGPNVEQLDGNEAVLRYQPDVVIACWVTHKYNPQEHERGGNMYGIDEARLLEHCKTYIHIGNSNTHKLKPLLAVPHRLYRPHWLVSRSMSPELNEIRIWGETLPGEAV